ncbi:hypothetical protein LCGC14_1820010 [marine sediment metagenome]|uniref:HNH nuclease domain-containing protein n=1 Tax=marine sediment metagenome TaxID=412755 RepID=A0A0F9IZ03_9ZZZZ
MPYRMRMSPWVKRGIQRAVLEHSDGKCTYCPQTLDMNTVTLDHIVPHCKGGPNKLSNLVAACSSCNTKRGSRNFAEFLFNQRVAVAHGY